MFRIDGNGLVWRGSQILHSFWEHLKRKFIKMQTGVQCHMTLSHLLYQTPRELVYFRRIYIRFHVLQAQYLQCEAFRIYFSTSKKLNKTNLLLLLVQKLFRKVYICYILKNHIICSVVTFDLVLEISIQLQKFLHLFLR